MSDDKSLRSSMTPSTSTPTPTGDHRKRRRNRTTQSCLNCHASKRMCDRRRPACQRCTTLGLTGLCVYEVDDPSQRSNFSDEKSHLRSRVAELEGVIREMKNKPHPRWTQKSAAGQIPGSQSSDDDFEPPSSSETSKEPVGKPISESHQLPLLFVEPLEPAHMNMPGIQLTPVSLSPGAASSCESLLTPQDPYFLSAYSLPSPPSSPASNSPKPGHQDPNQSLNIDTSAAGNSNFNVDGMLASTSLKHTGFEDGIYGHMLDHIMGADDVKRTASYNCETSAPARARETCGCIDNATAYNNLLELSVRLRKAVESLGRVTDHHQAGVDLDCQLYSKICELDKLTSTALGNAMSPADRLTTNNTYLSPSSSEFSSTISPHCLSSMPQWDNSSVRPAFSGTSDNLMSWDSLQREAWTHTSIS